MSYKILLHPDVITQDLKKMDGSVKPLIAKAIENKLSIDPLSYGVPLRKSLKGGRKLRVGNYRILFEIEDEIIKIYRIDHRSVIYEKIPVKRNF